MNKQWLLAQIEDIEKNGYKLYPCTIVVDEYGGAYSNGEFLAFREHNDSKFIGEAMSGEYEFWEAPEYQSKIEMIGRGSSPSNAYNDLKRRWLEWIKKRLADPQLKT